MLRTTALPFPMLADILQTTAFLFPMLADILYTPGKSLKDQLPIYVLNMSVMHHLPIRMPNILVWLWRYLVVRNRKIPLI